MTEVDVTVSIGRILPIAVASTYEPAPSGLTATPNAAGGTFAAGTYYWVVTGTDAFGETTASNEATAVIVLNGTATLVWNPLPAGTTGVKVYRGTAPGAENALIVTLGAVITYTDTGTAGSAATPPALNTAQIGQQTVYNGKCTVIGWGLRETSGTAKVDLSIRNAAQECIPVVLASGTADVETFPMPGLYFRSGCFIRVNSGVFSGSIYIMPVDY